MDRESQVVFEMTKHIHQIFHTLAWKDFFRTCLMLLLMGYGAFAKSFTLPFCILTVLLGFEALISHRLELKYREVIIGMRKKGAKDVWPQ